jgi:hypothetical protein
MSTIRTGSQTTTIMAGIRDGCTIAMITGEVTSRRIGSVRPRSIAVAAAETPIRGATSIMWAIEMVLTIDMTTSIMTGIVDILISVGTDRMVTVVLIIMWGRITAVIMMIIMMTGSAIAGIIGKITIGADSGTVRITAMTETMGVIVVTKAIVVVMAADTTIISR